MSDDQNIAMSRPAGFDPERLTMTQISQVTGIPRDRVQRCLKGLQPSNRRAGADTFRLRDIIHRFYKPTADDIEHVVARLRPVDFPPRLQAAYWRGLSAQQDYMERRGELWPTLHVIEVVGDLVKGIALRLRLMSDHVERQTEFSDRQRYLLAELIRETQAEMAASVEALSTGTPSAPDPRDSVDDPDEI